jgi:hypothetical protein
MGSLLTVARVVCDPNGNPVLIVNDSGVYRFSTISKILDSVGNQIDPAKNEILIAIKDVDGIKKIVDPLPSGDNEIGRIKVTDGSNIADIVVDSEDGTKCLAIKGKVTLSEAEAPEGATLATIDASTPLVISTVHNTIWTIPDGVTFTVTFFGIGGQGDPTGKNSKGELFYDDNGTFRLIDSLYMSGFSLERYLTTSYTRDGVKLTGNSAGTQKIVLRRTRFSGNALEVDAVVRGYCLPTIGTLSHL